MWMEEEIRMNAEFKFQKKGSFNDALNSRSEVIVLGYFADEKFLQLGTLRSPQRLFSVGEREARDSAISGNIFIH
jgi:hypothetical protein